MFKLATIITSKTRLEVMRLFLTTPDLELGVRETARKLDINPMQVRNELVLLADSGVLKFRHVANSVQYSLDTSCEAVQPLQRLVEVETK